MPALKQQEASELITGSEQISKEYDNGATLTAKDVKKLIEDVYHNQTLVLMMLIRTCWSNLLIPSIVAI